MLDRILGMPALAWELDAPTRGLGIALAPACWASRCEANFAITFPLDIRGRRPGITFGFGGIGGFAVASATAAAARDIRGGAPEGFDEGLIGAKGWLNIRP